MIKDEGKEKATRIIQGAMRGSRSYKHFKYTSGVCIPEQSATNFEKLQEYIGNIDDGERRLLKMVIDNLRICHFTAYLDKIKKNNGRLASIGIRRYEDHATSVHTHNQFAAQEFNYFTMLISPNDDPSRGYVPPSFLNKNNGHVIIISLKDYYDSCEKNNEANALNWGFISTHHAEYNHEANSPVAFLGTTKYFIKHHKNRSKTTVYVNEDGKEKRRTVSFEEEIYHGRNIPEAIAYQLIDHLRIIGGEFRTNFYSKLQGNELSDIEKLDCVSDFFKTTMLTTMYPEYKVPGVININLAQVNSIELKNKQEKKQNDFLLEEFKLILNNYGEVYRDLYILINSSTKQRIDLILSNWKPCFEPNDSIKIIDEKCEAIIEFIEKNKNTLKDLPKNQINNYFFALKKISDPKFLAIIYNKFIEHGVIFLHENFDSSLLWQLLDDFSDRDSSLELINLVVTQQFDVNPNIMLKIGHALNRRKPSLDNRNPLEHCVQLEKKACYELLVKSGADVGQVAHDLLFYAANRYDDTWFLKIIENLQAEKYDFKRLEKSGSILLFLAKKSKTNLMEVLIDAGASLDVRDDDLGFTIFHFLAENNSYDAIEKLIIGGYTAYIDALALNGETPLSIACNKKFEKLAELLIKYGADKNKILNSRPSYKKIIHSASLIVMNEKEIVLGDKQESSTYSGLLMFPGGLGEPGESLKNTAIRECGEETSFDFFKYIEDNDLSVEEFFEYEISKDSDRLNKHAFFVLKVKNDFDFSKLFANDDMREIRAIPINNIFIKEQETNKSYYAITKSNNVKFKVRPSNAMIIKILRNEKPQDKNLYQERLRELLNLENNGASLVRNAIYKSDINGFKYLASYKEALSYIFSKKNKDVFSSENKDVFFEAAFKYSNNEFLSYFIEDYPVDLSAIDPEEIIDLLIINPNIIDVIQNNKSIESAIIKKTDALLRALYLSIKVDDIYLLAINDVKLFQANCFDFFKIIINKVDDTLEKRIFYKTFDCFPCLLNHAINNKAYKHFDYLIDKYGEKIINPPLNELGHQEGMIKLTPLMAAVLSKNEELVKKLLVKNADVNACLELVIDGAFQKNTQEKIDRKKQHIFNWPDFFSENQKNIFDKAKYTPFVLAFKFGYMEIADILLQSKEFDNDLNGELLKSSLSAKELGSLKMRNDYGSRYQPIIKKFFPDGLVIEMNGLQQ